MRSRKEPYFSEWGKKPLNALVGEGWGRLAGNRRKKARVNEGSKGGGLGVLKLKELLSRGGKSMGAGGGALVG